MHTLHWITLVAGLVLSPGNLCQVPVAPSQQTEARHEITLTTAQVQSTVRAPMTWRVTLEPNKESRNDPFELRPDDARTGDWLEGVQAFATLSDTAALDLSAVPLVSGDLTSTLEASYTVGVEPYVEAGVIARQGTAREKESLSVELWIRNHSPFTLTQVQVRGIGADLAWGAPTDLKDVAPGSTYFQVLTPTVTGQHPQPQLGVDFAWSDATGTSHNRMLYITGKTIALSESISSRIPPELIGVVIGVVTGALVTLIPGLITDWRSRRRQEKANQQNVRGLLGLMTLQSKHAANNGVKIDLALLETIFKQEGLFSVLEQGGLADSVRDLWKAAERHNSGLDQPGGAQRSEDLRKAAQRLDERLHNNSGKWDTLVNIVLDKTRLSS